MASASFDLTLVTPAHTVREVSPLNRAVRALYNALPADVALRIRLLHDGVHVLPAEVTATPQVCLHSTWEMLPPGQASVDALLAFCREKAPRQDWDAVLAPPEPESPAEMGAPGPMRAPALSASATINEDQFDAMMRDVMAEREARRKRRREGAHRMPVAPPSAASRSEEPPVVQLEQQEGRSMGG